MREYIQLLFRSQRFVLGFSLFTFVLLFSLVGPVVWNRDPFSMVGGLFNPPSRNALLGTDNFGRDVLTQLMHGTRTSLLIGLIAGVVATTVGVAIGTIAAYRGGLLEELLMGVTNVLITVPTIVILILLSIAIGTRSAVVMGLIIGVTAWPWTARAVRAQTASLRTREHLDIARLSGASFGQMIVFEILPYMMSYVSMAFILQMSGGILNEATLSMLGLGPDQSVSLGMMLHWSLLWEATRTGAWWAFLPPVVFLSITTFSLMCMNSGMDEVFNPRLRRG